MTSPVLSATRMKLSSLVNCSAVALLGTVLGGEGRGGEGRGWEERGGEGRRGGERRDVQLRVLLPSQTAWTKTFNRL